MIVEKMSEPSLRRDLQVIVTHVEHSARGREEPCVFLWGKCVENNSWISVDECIESIKKILEHEPPPLQENLKVGQFYCVLINQQWCRACVKPLKLDADQKVKLQLVDSGASYCVSLASLRSLENIPGKMAEHLRERQPVAFKFVLADIVASRELNTHCQWSDQTISFLKNEVENQNWAANLLGNYEGYQVLRLFHPSEHYLLATSMIRQGFGVTSQNYQEAVSTKWVDGIPSSQRPAYNPSSLVCNMPKVNSLTPSFALPPDHGHHPFPYPTAIARLIPPPIPNRQLFYVANELPQMGRHEVVVSHVSEGPFKFYLLLKSAALQLDDVRRKLELILPRKFSGVLQLDSPCLAFSQTDKLYHRGQIITSTDAGDFGDQRSVYFVDMGTKELVDLDSIYDIPDELMEAPIPQSVSLNRVEEVSELCDLQAIFTALVNPSNFLQCEVVGSSANQKVNLYDQAGKSLLDLLSVHSNLLTNSRTDVRSTVEEGANQTKSESNKDWKSSADFAQEVIRAPRRPTSPIRNERTKDPVNFLRQTPVEKTLLFKSTDAPFLSPDQKLIESIQNDTYGRIYQKPPIDKPIKVIFSYFTRKSESRFYIRYCCHETKLKEMMKEIQILGPQAEPVDSLKESLTYLFKHKNLCWYRVRIIFAGDFGVLCHSLDYGKTFTVPLKNSQIYFRIMNESLKQVPSFAIYVEFDMSNIRKFRMKRSEKHKLIDKKCVIEIVREGYVKLVKFKGFYEDKFAVNLSENRFTGIER